MSKKNNDVYKFTINLSNYLALFKQILLNKLYI